jgi:hypothetical protein
MSQTYGYGYALKCNSTKMCVNSFCNVPLKMPFASFIPKKQNELVWTFNCAALMWWRNNWYNFNVNAYESGYLNIIKIIITSNIIICVMHCCTNYLFNL